MKLFLPKKWIKKIKQILISRFLHYFLKIAFFITFLLLLLFNDNFTPEWAGKTKMNAILNNFLEIVSGTDFSSYQNLLNLIKNDFKNNFFAENEIFRIFGPIRLDQYVIKLPNFCYNDLKAKYSSECNPYFINFENSLVNTLTLPTDPNQCIEQGCSEFRINKEANVYMKTRWKNNRISTDNVFTVEIQTKNEDDFNNQLDKIMKNNWIHEKNTKILIVNINLLEFKYNSIHVLKIILEKPEQIGCIYSLSMQKNIIKAWEDKILIEILMSFFSILTIFKFFRIIFICSYFPNFGKILELFIFALDLIFLILYLTEFSEYWKIINENFFVNYLDRNYNIDGYLNFSRLIQISYSKMIVVFFQLLFWNVRIYLLITNFTNIKMMIKIQTAFIRSFLGILKFIFFFVVISISWTLGLFQFFIYKIPIFSDYFSSYLGFFIFDIESISDIKKNREIYESENPPFSIFAIFSLFLMRSLLYSFFLGVTINCLGLAISHEYDHAKYRDKNVADFLNINEKKLKKISKNYLLNFDEEKKIINNKMIIWLDNDLLSKEENVFLREKVKDLNINLIAFDQANQIIEFLEFLFKLKPNLMSKSGDSFRIILENLDKSTDSSQFLIYNSYELGVIGKILDWLRFAGSRVPVALYSKTNLKQMTIINLKKKYPYLIVVDSYIDCEDFCCLKSMNQRDHEESQEISEFSFMENDEEEKFKNTEFD